MSYSRHLHIISQIGDAGGRTDLTAGGSAWDDQHAKPGTCHNEPSNERKGCRHLGLLSCLRSNGYRIFGWFCDETVSCRCCDVQFYELRVSERVEFTEITPVSWTYGVDRVSSVSTFDHRLFTLIVALWVRSKTLLKRPSEIVVCFLDQNDLDDAVARNLSVCAISKLCRLINCVHQSQGLM